MPVYANKAVYVDSQMCSTRSNKNSTGPLTSITSAFLYHIWSCRDLHLRSFDLILPKIAHHQQHIQTNSNCYHLMFYADEMVPKVALSHIFGIVVTLTVDLRPSKPLQFCPLAHWISVANFVEISSLLPRLHV